MARKYDTDSSLKLKIGAHEKRRLFRITLGAFAEAQDGYCPLCGLKDFWAPIPAGRARDGRQENFFEPSFDHVYPHKRLASMTTRALPAKRGTAFDFDSGMYGILGNCLVVHKGCNSRKGAAMPLSHELAILNLVNERMGWDGRYYTNTADSESYKNIVTAIKYQGWDYMLSRHDRSPDLIVRAAVWSGSEDKPRFFSPRREPISTYRDDEDHPRHHYQRLLISPLPLGPSLPAPRLWTSQTRIYHQSKRLSQTPGTSGLR